LSVSGIGAAGIGRPPPRARIPTRLAASAGRLVPSAERLVPIAGWLTAHRVFLVALALGAGLRVVVMLGYPPVMWFNDSYDYVAVALYPHPDRLRPSGYALVLRSLLPFHSFALVAAVQHIIGLATATLCYALPRRFGLPGWAATLVAVPVLFDAYQLQLEHVVMADTLFVLLVAAAVFVVCRPGRAAHARHARDDGPTPKDGPAPEAGAAPDNATPDNDIPDGSTRRDRHDGGYGRGRRARALLPSVTACAAAGLLLGLAAITRAVGLPLLLVLAGYLLVRRVGGRALVAALVAGAVPVVAYATWFHAVHGRYALSGADGVFLYSRTMAFADCAQMRPPPRLRPLCASLPPPERPPSQMYMWDRRAPLFRRSATLSAPSATPAPHGTRAPHATPAPHPRAASGVAAPAPARSADPSATETFTPTVNARAGEFAGLAIRSQPLDYLAVVGRDTLRTFRWERTPFPDPQTYALYQFDPRIEPPPAWAPRYLDRYDAGWAQTRTVEPYAGFLGAYQRYVRLPGAVLGVILLAAGALAAWPRRRSALLPLAVAAALILIPPATAEFGYRYVLAAVPLACLAAGLALAPARRDDDVTASRGVEYHDASRSRNVLSVPSRSQTAHRAHRQARTVRHRR
jgi:hypothetical protein